MQNVQLMQDDRHRCRTIVTAHNDRHMYMQNDLHRTHNDRSRCRAYNRCSTIVTGAERSSQHTQRSSQMQNVQQMQEDRHRCRTIVTAHNDRHMYMQNDRHRTHNDRSRCRTIVTNANQSHNPNSRNFCAFVAMLAALTCSYAVSFLGDACALLVGCCLSLASRRNFLSQTAITA